MPAGNPFAYEPMRLGEAFLRGEAIARDREQQRQAMALRQAAEDRARREDEYAQQVRPLDLMGRQLALRGQLLGTVETPEDYARVLPSVQAAGLPTGDLPAGNQSTAWLTFRKQEDPRTSPAWLPERFAPAAVMQPHARAMPTGVMESPGISAEDVGAIQRAAGRGLTIGQQTQFSDKNIGRQLQEAQIAANLAKYEEQARFREMAEGRAEKRIQMQETKDEREARLASERIAMDRERLRISREEADRAAKGGKFSVDQSNAATYGRRIEAGLADLDRLSSRGYDPTDIKNAAMISALITGKPGATLVAGPEARQAAQTYRNIINSILRRESGAVISPSEFENAQAQYFPSVNDDPETLAQKRRNLEQALEGLKTGAGGAWEATAPVARPAGEKRSTSPAGLPPAAVATLREGKRTTFKNGQVWTLQNGKPVQVK